MSLKTRHGLPRQVGVMVGRSMRLAARDRKPRLLEIELTHRCAGSCNYCYASGRPQAQVFLEAEVVRRVLDEAVEMGIRMLWWMGGDPLFHPQWPELVRYAGKLRLAQVMTSSGLISKKAARQLVEVQEYLNLSFHLDTVDPRAYAQVNRHPVTLQGRIRSYENLLAAGFDPARVTGQVTLVRPVMDSFSRTLDWFHDQMKAAFVLMRVFKPLGQGREAAHLEPSLEAVRRSVELRDTKYGVNQNFRSLNVGVYLCHTNVGIHPDGEVTPCLFLYGQNLGNVNRESLREIVERHRDEIFFNYEPEGPCGTCEAHHDPELSCMGCRVNALAYTGNVRGSDPKCWYNPEAPQYCLA